MKLYSLGDFKDWWKALLFHAGPSSGIREEKEQDSFGDVIVL